MPPEPQNDSKSENTQADHGKPARPTDEGGSAEASKSSAPESPIVEPLPASESEPIVPAIPVLPTPAPMSVPPPKSAKYFLTLALKAIQFRKKAKMEKIIKFVTAKGSVTNDQVEKLIHVSDATATRYLSQLAREHRLQRVGTPEHAVYKLP